MIIIIIIITTKQKCVCKAPFRASQHRVTQKQRMKQTKLAAPLTERWTWKQTKTRGQTDQNKRKIKKRWKWKEVWTDWSLAVVFKVPLKSTGRKSSGSALRRLEPQKRASPLVLGLRRERDNKPDQRPSDSHLYNVTAAAFYCGQVADQPGLLKLESTEQRKGNGKCWCGLCIQTESLYKPHKNNFQKLSLYFEFLWHISSLAFALE